EDVSLFREAQARGDLRRGGHGQGRHCGHRHRRAASEGRDDRKAASVSNDQGSTPPISSARDSKTWTSASSEERMVALVGTPTMWVSISRGAICARRIIETGPSLCVIKGSGKCA